MDDLISRQETIDAIENKTYRHSYLEQIIDIVNEVPSIDAVEVVRCKDCKYSDTFSEDAHNDMPLKCLEIRYGGVHPDWFCEHAERR